jgi:hypothetical protein
MPLRRLQGLLAVVSPKETFCPERPQTFVEIYEHYRAVLMKQQRCAATMQMLHPRFSAFIRVKMRNPWRVSRCAAARFRG